MPVTLARRPLPKPDPQSDPRFRKISEQLKQGAAKTKAHPPASKKAADAAKAAKGPPNERLAGGKAKQVDKIKEAKEGKPEQSSFLAILRAEIAKAMPKTLGETENFLRIDLPAGREDQPRRDELLLDPRNTIVPRCGADARLAAEH